MLPAKCIQDLALSVEMLPNVTMSKGFPVHMNFASAIIALGFVRNDNEYACAAHCTMNGLLLLFALKFRFMFCQLRPR